MENALSQLSGLTEYLPMDIDFPGMLRFILIFAAGALLIGFIGRFVFGRRSALNQSVSASMGILFVYALTVVIYTFNPADLERFLAPLPFVTFSGEYMVLFSFSSASLPAVCSQIVSMIILAFLFNLLDSLIPRGKRLIGWYLYRFLTILLAMAGHYLITLLSTTFLPGVLVTYAPIILLGVLLAFLLLGLLKIVLGLVLSAVNPVLGGIYAFFFSHLIGKQVTKAIFTTILLSIVFYLLERFGYTIICIASAALPAYIPLILVLLVLWYLIGHVL